MKLLANEIHSKNFQFTRYRFS